MRKKESEYHTGRLNISCPPSIKDAIARDATERDQSISQFILDLYAKSSEVGTSEHLARMGLELVGLKKRLLDIDVQLRRSLGSSQGIVDKHVAQDLSHLRELQAQIDAVLTETVTAVKELRKRELS